MADALRTPWILDYLISVAERYGGNLSAVPRTEKASKAQLVKFLTFPASGSKGPCFIWADVSDKKHLIHARLSIDAVERLMKHPEHAGNSITSYKSAVVRLKKVRPAFGRVARRESGGGMTDKPRLYLDVDEIELVGSYGEAMWGAPVDVAQDPNIREWMVGHQQEGGGGNVLKLKKERLLAQAAVQADKLQANTMDILRQTTINAMDVKVQVARRSSALKPRPSTDTVGQRPIVSKEAVRRASWKRLHTNMMQYIRPPDDVYEQLLLLCGISRAAVFESVPDKAQSPDLRSRTRSQSASTAARQPSARTSVSPTRRSPSPTNSTSPARTPSHWSPSVQGSSPPLGDETSATEDESDDDLFKESDTSMDEEAPTDLRADIPEVGMDVDPPAADPEASPSRSLPMPPPAQPRIQAPPSSMPSIPYASSPPRASSPTAYNPSKDTLDTLPPSSLPIPSYRLPPSPTSSPRPAPVPVTPAYPAAVVRRVPLPQFSSLRRDPDASGEGRVLVENSDTASPGSQRPSQSQSQSQSQSHSQSSDGDRSQSQSQSQRPSQLRNEVVPMTRDQRDPESRDGAVHGAEDGIQGGVPDEGGQAGEGAGDSQESQEQPQRRSQQSLSYKGDSQSQEGVDAPAPTAEDVVPPDSQTPADGSLPASGENVEEPPEADVPTEDTVAPDERPPSPMAIDQDMSATSSAPRWAAITSVDDSEDSQTEVDELLSDPLAAPIPDSATPTRQRAAPRPGRSKASVRKTVPRQSVGDGEERLEPDDARTAGMIEEYVVKAQKVIEMRKRATDRADVLPPPPDAEALGEGSAGKGKGREAGQDEAASGPSQPAHDPAIWAAPAFMRKTKAQEVAGPSTTRAPPSKTTKAPPAKPFAAPPVPEPQTKKRSARTSSPSPVHDQSPVKKRKTSGGAVPALIPLPATTSQAKQKPAVPSLAGAKPPLSRPSSSASSSRPVAGPSNVNRQSFTRPSTGSAGGSGSAGSSRDVKHVDLRAASRSSSRASSHAPRTHGQAATPLNQAASAAEASNRPLSGSAKGKSVASASSSREGQQDSVTSRPTASRSGSSASLAKADRRSSSRAAGPVAGPSSQRSGKASSSAAVSAARSSRDPDAPLLGGLSEIQLEPTRTDGGPPLLGWDELLEILLKTGKVRFRRKQEKEREAAGDK